MSEIDSTLGMGNIETTGMGLPGTGSARDKEALKQKATEAKDAVKDLAGEAKRYASHRVEDMKEKAGEMMDTAKQKVNKANEDMTDYVQRKPFQSMAIAAGIGFVAGLILKRL